MQHYRVYRLPHGQGFYIVFEDNKAYLCPEELSFEEAAKAASIQTDDVLNCWDAFIEDFKHFGINGFGWWFNKSC